MKKLTVICAILFFTSSAYAGLGFHVTIINMTNHKVLISHGGNDNWKRKDFHRTQVIDPNKSKHFYTEEKTLFNGHDGIQGIDINYGSTLHHVELWTSHHSHSVSENISTTCYMQGIVYLQGADLLHSLKQNLYCRSVYVGSSTKLIDTKLSYNANEGIFGTFYVDLIMRD